MVLGFKGSVVGVSRPSSLEVPQCMEGNHRVLPKVDTYLISLSKPLCYLLRHQCLFIRRRHLLLLALFELVIRDKARDCIENDDCY